MTIEILIRHHNLEERNVVLKKEIAGILDILDNHPGIIRCFHKGDDAHFVEHKTKFENELHSNNEKLVVLAAEIKKLPKDKQKLEPQYRKESHYKNVDPILIKTPENIHKTIVNSVQVIIDGKIIDSVDIPLMPGMSMEKPEPNNYQIVEAIEKLKNKFYQIKATSQYRKRIRFKNEGKILIKEPETINKIRINSIKFIIEDKIIESVDVPLMLGWGMSMEKAEPDLNEIAKTVKKFKMKFSQTKLTVISYGVIKFEQII